LRLRVTWICFNGLSGEWRCSTDCLRQTPCEEQAVLVT
jgi:hypothetical protein